MKEPRRFALTREKGESDQVVGYGLVLPDGSALSVSWPSTNTLYSAASAEETASLRGAELQWIDQQ